MNYNDPALRDKIRAKVYGWLMPVQAAAVSLLSAHGVHEDLLGADPDVGLVAMVFAGVASTVAAAATLVVRLVGRRLDSDGDGRLEVEDLADLP